MMIKKTVLVTGGSGLVGSAFKSISIDEKLKYNLKYNFVFLSSLECDLTDYNQTMNYFNEVKPNFIIHLAANVGGLFKNMSQPVDMLEKNVLINLNVLKAAHSVSVEKLIACLSTCIFPDKPFFDKPLVETDLHLGPPHDSNSAYAYAKRLLETQCLAYQKQYGDNFICVIPTNIYGPEDNFNLEDAHVIPALIHKCYLAKEKNEYFYVSGSGNPLRQFIHSRDLALGIMLVLEDYNEMSSIIISPDETSELSIGHIAQLIAKEFDYSHMLKFDSSKSDGQYKKTVSNNKFREFTNFFNFTEIDEGLKMTINWFLMNYSNVRK
jgi:GDP-L-fucose synthase